KWSVASTMLRYSWLWRTASGRATSLTSRATPAPSPTVDRIRRSGSDSRYALTVTSMGQAVHDVVDAQLVRLVRRVEGKKPLPRPLPILGHVVVVVGDDHQPFRRIVVLV